MKILPEFDLNMIRTLITADFPDLQIEKIILIENGWDNMVVEINGDLIFRFPKDEEADFEVEVKVLGALKGKISVRIPEVGFLGNPLLIWGMGKYWGAI